MTSGAVRWGSRICAQPCPEPLARVSHSVQYCLCDSRFLMLVLVAGAVCTVTSMMGDVETKRPSEGVEASGRKNVVKLLPDGRLLMQDGSIRKPETKSESDY